MLLERFYDTLSAEIELAGGTVETFAGHAVMAVFGAPAAHMFAGTMVCSGKRPPGSGLLGLEARERETSG